MRSDSSIRERRAASRLKRVVLLVIAFMSISCGVALGVVGGRTVSIAAAPWTVFVQAGGRYHGKPKYWQCTGVIIDSRHVLTAAHCLMQGGSVKPISPAGIAIEAGVSNVNHPDASGHPQGRTVSVWRYMRGYIASSKITNRNALDAASHDLAVLTLSRPLDLSGRDVRAAALPTVNTHVKLNTYSTGLVIAGYGNETDDSANGTLNEVSKLMVSSHCGSSRALCIFMPKADTCWGDSGLGAIETHPRPTVVGILSSGAACLPPGLDDFVSLSTPAALSFIKADS